MAEETKVGAVRVSTCSESNPVWQELALVPLTVDPKGEYRFPLTQTLHDTARSDTFKKLSQSSDVFSVQMLYGGNENVLTYLPLRQIHFEMGKAKPIDPKEFNGNIGFVIAKLRSIVEGNYGCVTWGKTRPIVYVAGYADRVGATSANLRLSQTRAQVIATELFQKLHMETCYVGRGEEQTSTEDEVAMPAARRTDVMIASRDRPFRAQWKCLGVKK